LVNEIIDQLDTTLLQLNPSHFSFSRPYKVLSQSSLVTTISNKVVESGYTLEISTDINSASTFFITIRAESNKIVNYNDNTMDIYVR
jgi:hypothetical protein